MIRLFIQEYKGEERLFAEIPNSNKFNDLMRNIPGSRWSNSLKRWHFQVNLKIVDLICKKAGDGKVDLSTFNLQFEKMKKVHEVKKYKRPGSRVFKSAQLF